MNIVIKTRRILIYSINMDCMPNKYTDPGIRDRARGPYSGFSLMLEGRCNSTAICSRLNDCLESCGKLWSPIK